MSKMSEIIPRFIRIIFGVIIVTALVVGFPVGTAYLIWNAIGGGIAGFLLAMFGFVSAGIIGALTVDEMIMG